jgi:hypothetical protein
MAHNDDGHESGSELAVGSGTSTRKLGLVAGINFVGFVVELATPSTCCLICWRT